MIRHSVPKPRSQAPAPGPAEPFATGEEAWFWYVRCQKARLEGARFVAGLAEVERPCEPDDVYRAVTDLRRRRLLGAWHLSVLGLFGWREAPPDARCGDERKAARLWEEALARLESVLRPKGIVA